MSSGLFDSDLICSNDLVCTGSSVVESRDLSFVGTARGLWMGERAWSCLKKDEI